MTLGLVGCGRLAERGYVEAIRRARGVRLVSLADPKEARCTRLAKGVPTYGDMSALVADGDADAVILATPAHAHLEGARIASAAGLSALVEKPPAPNFEEAAAMAALDRPPALGFNRRFEPGMTRLRERVPACGELEVAIALHHPGDSWRSYEASDDALLTLGPHLIDLVRWLTRSEIERVRALELSPIVATLELSLDRGLARISCSTAESAADLVEIRQGDRLRLRRSGLGAARRALRRLRRPLGAGALVRSLALQVEEFSHWARGGANGRLGTGLDGALTMGVVDAARESASSSGEWRGLSAVRASLG